jgi:hypothetical protein
MKPDDQKPEPKPSGSMKPPGPPIRTAIGVDSGGEEPDKPKKKAVTIHLTPKPTKPKPPTI